jgi:hypothetical protein
MSDEKLKSFSERERRIAIAIMQLKAEPFCTDCGGSCVVVLEQVTPDKPSNIWTACTMCGNEMVWTATPNHAEMLKRIVALTEQQQGKVIEEHEFIRSADGSCRGLCGGICPTCWRPGNVEEDSDDDSDSSSGPELF